MVHTHKSHMGGILIGVGARSFNTSAPRRSYEDTIQNILISELTCYLVNNGIELSE